MDPSWEQIKVTIDLGPRARANSAATLLRQTAMPLPRSCRMASRGSHVCHDSPYHLSWRKIHMELVVSTYPKRMVFHQLVVDLPTPLKKDGVSSSVGMMIFPTEWKNKNCSKLPTRYHISIIYLSVSSQSSFLH